MAPSLPDGVGVTIWNDDSQTYSERAEILRKNGIMGLLLVFISLALFLEIRLALWVVAGLVTSGIGALAVMLALDLAINTISLFAFVLAIGIIVDDAIVVAEHIHYERNRGVPGVVAAIRGTRRIKKALIFAVLTSVAAFTPLLFIPGGIGEVWSALPVIVIGMLLISLAEALLILPKHLSHLHGPEWTPDNMVDRFFACIRDFVDRWLNRFLDGPLDGALRFATNHPAIMVAGSSAYLLSACPWYRRVLSRRLSPPSWRATSSPPLLKCRTGHQPSGPTRWRWNWSVRDDGFWNAWIGIDRTVLPLCCRAST